MANETRRFSSRAVAVLPISFTAGQEIGECCKEALRLANLLDVSVEWTMNGVSMFATRSMVVTTLEAHYYEQLTQLLHSRERKVDQPTKDSQEERR
jgi:hypothetical protein